MIPKLSLIFVACAVFVGGNIAANASPYVVTLDSDPISGPTNFGPGGLFAATSSSGKLVAFSPSQLVVPTG
jgi:hypothetical protein